MNQLDRWAADLTKKVYDKWKKDYSFWELGFKTFYSPVRKNPPLLILTLNPGVSKNHSLQEWKNKLIDSRFFPPMKNEYVDKCYPFAKKIRLLFEGSHVLEKSVALPILFFRSNNYKHWKSNVPKDIRADMEKYSFAKTKQIIEKLKPKACLIIGYKTYDKVRDVLDINAESDVSCGAHRLYTTAYSGNISLFVMPHLTGYRLSTQKRGKIRKALEKFLA